MTGDVGGVAAVGGIERRLVVCIVLGPVKKLSDLLIEMDNALVRHVKPSALTWPPCALGTMDGGGPVNALYLRR